MKVLLGADILIAANDSMQDFGTIGWLFQWFDRLGIDRYIDFPTLVVMTHFGGVNKDILNSCGLIKKVIRKSPHLKQVIGISPLSLSTSVINSDKAVNALIAQIAFLQTEEVDYIISDNEYLHSLARKLEIDDRVYSVAEFIDKCAIENRAVDPSKGLIVEETLCSNLDVNDVFFDTFKKDYPGYIEWFQRKTKDFVFISKNGKKIIALLKLKIERSRSEFNDIEPELPNVKTLKISSFKIEPNRTKLAERFIRIIFNYAICHDVQNIYVTFFDNYEQKHRLKRLLNKWGFTEWGHKKDSDEIVLTRPLIKSTNYLCPSKTFPFHGIKKGHIQIPVF